MRQQRLMDRLSSGAIRPDKLRWMLAWARRAMEVREQIVESNMPLITAMLKRFRFEKRDPDELISDGEVTLLRCVDKFDCSRGYKFSTYACRSLLKCFARVGVNRRHRESRCLVGFDPELEPSDFADRKHEEAESEFLLRLRRVMLTNGARLTAREQMVIRWRFLAGGGPRGPRPLTLKQAGNQIGVTRERIRQIEDIALRKLRRALDDRTDRSVWSRAG
jgi:RNA polymerase sigma factor (sigma-70 family)